jgi:hypothetical protein
MQGLETDLDSLRALKRRAEDLASTHLEALGLFHLAEEVSPLANLSDEVVGIGGFANLMPGEEVARDGTAKASLASTARCVRSLRVSRDLRRGNADYTPFIEAAIDRHARQDLATYGLDHLNPFTLGQVLPVLREVAGSDPSDADADAFDGLYQPEVTLPDPDGAVLLLDLLKERLVEPLRAPGERPLYTLVQHPDRSQMIRCGIPFRGLPA